MSTPVAKQLKQANMKVTHMLWIALAVVVFILIVPLAALLIVSPGKLQPYQDGFSKPVPGSVSEKIKMKIGGVDQGMILRGRSDKNPVLLFLHGGPGMPEYFLMEKYAKGLEDRFTVCYWEQRGAGLSYQPGNDVAAITTERLVDDTIEVADYLRQRFGQDRIILMAHSWGTYLGIQAAAKAPDRFRAYVAVAQSVNVIESERLCFQYMLEQYQAQGNRRRLKQLAEYNVLGSDQEARRFFESLPRDITMHELGIGTMHNMDSVITGVVLPQMACRAYTVGEKFTVWKAKAILRSQTVLLDELFSTDMSHKVRELTIPVYFMSGIHDYTVNYSLSKAYFEVLKAPVKGFYTYANSAHSPMCEEPERFLQILSDDVLAGTAELADRD